MIRASGAIPTMPMPLSATAAMTPLTSVPCMSCAKLRIIGIDKVVPPNHPPLQVGMIKIHARVDHRDLYAGAA